MFSFPAMNTLTATKSERSHCYEFLYSYYRFEGWSLFKHLLRSGLRFWEARNVKKGGELMVSTCYSWTRRLSVVKK
ncbi:hypothetical protein Bca4012_032307 [Brassica carinata]